MRQSYNGSLSQPSKLMTRVRLPSAALETYSICRSFFLLLTCLGLEIKKKTQKRLLYPFWVFFLDFYSGRPFFQLSDSKILSFTVNHESSVILKVVELCWSGDQKLFVVTTAPCVFFI